MQTAKKASIENRQPIHVDIGWHRINSNSFFYQVAVGSLLGKMLYDLSELYGTSLPKQKNKAIIAAVLGGAHSEWITVYLGDNIEKFLPGMSAISNPIARPVVAAGITYAIGRLFIKHFDSGRMVKRSIGAE